MSFLSFSYGALGLFFNILFKDIYIQIKGDLGLYYSSCFTRIVFWNNESFIQSIKQLEKFTVFLVFPLIFIFQQRPINIRKILTYYSSIFSTILFFSLYITYM
ncbi:MAG: hypothetical protein CM15mP121_0780 [Bacteroidota bacterium]|nr:MAG: hypothetical protein CM15mP121_0780 [Bacteroidota bacterium]